ncbi:unnamed protein product [Fraxinus pennsylvanica]|uniref:Pentatricopeptide repeat-containing protein n=1 Tax=Fraxinus pennsylvanica TaxID=56036 RepID=A0AAD2A4A9_9LAMI|nr:unnamed protein product [Fraxinus pennsylvanica]
MHSFGGFCPGFTESHMKWDRERLLVDPLACQISERTAKITFLCYPSQSFPASSPINMLSPHPCFLTSFNSMTMQDCLRKHLKTFYKILEFNIKPLVKHLSCILEILVAYRNFLQAAFDLFWMKVKGCNPDIVHYNTVILGRASDACKVLEDMPSNGCLPILVSYRTVVLGCCAVRAGFCNMGEIEDASEVLREMLRHGGNPHIESWAEIIPKICAVDDTEIIRDILKEVLKVEIKPDTRIVEIGAGLEEYLIKMTQIRSRIH